MTRNRRAWVFLGIVLLILAILACGLFLVVRAVSRPPSGSVGGGGEGETAQPETQEAPPPVLPSTVGLLIASRDIPRGAQLTVQDVSVMNWPLLADAPPPPGSLQVASGEEGTAGLEQVAGRTARVDILNGQPVLDFMLTPS